MSAPYDVFHGLPRRIAIGAFTFKVKLVPPDHERFKNAEGDVDSVGFTDSDKQLILVNQDLPIHIALNVVQHEVSHAINWVMDVSDESTEEEFVTRHSNGLTEVQIRNPRYMQWVMKTIRRIRKEAASDE